MDPLIRKEKEAIAFIRKSHSLACDMSEDGFHVAFSGGKDSQTLLALMEESGCKYKAHMQITSVDPPQLMQFIRKNYPNVVLHRPVTNMKKLILKHGMLPMRQARFCCAKLKEQAGSGTCTCVGVRAAESPRRKKRSDVEVNGMKGIAFEIHGGGFFRKMKHLICLRLKRIRLSPVWVAMIRLLFRQYSNGAMVMFGISCVAITLIIANYITWVFIVLDVCFVLWLRQKRKQRNTSCSHGLLRKCI